MEDFYRRIELKAHFKNPENKTRFIKEDIFRKPTHKTWIPNNKYSIETFIEATRNDINNEIEKTKRPSYSNLSERKKALQELQSRDNIVITDADKGGAVVILDVEDYIKEAERQLHPTETYKRLNHNPTTTNNKTFNKIIKRFQKENVISKNIAEGLKIDSPKSPPFYLKSKLHKEGVPGRPVISSVNCHASKISEYVDYHLQPIVREIPSNVKDTSDFLRKFNAVEFVPDNSYFVSLDVKSLYTSIPNAEGIKAVRMSLDNHPKRTVQQR